jgi:Ni2+-binding GTPase involved in maturation of urease and hydrogenase
VSREHIHLAKRRNYMRVGGCPHAAIREDISANMHALEELQGIYQTELLFVESGGDNLAGELSVRKRSLLPKLTDLFSSNQQTIRESWRIISSMS